MESIGARSIPEFAGVGAVWPRGARLEAIRSATVAYRERFRRGGRIRALETHAIAAASYPTRFALQGAALAPTVPYVLLVSRLLVVQYEDFAGVARTLLWEPTIPDGAAEAPFHAQLEDRVTRLPGGKYLAHNVFSRHYATLEQALARAGVNHADVDYVSFGHLQAQDPRLLIGTTEPWADEPAPRAAMFPNARLIVQRREAATFASVHPIQWAWYVDGGMDDIVEESVVLVDGDLELGAGVSLLATPGNTDGHQSLALNTPDGLWVASHNGVALDNWQPQMSKIPGVRAHADFFNREVVPNANTLEDSLDQYDSMIKEKTLASPCQADPCWLQILPARELVNSRRHWPVLPTYEHGEITYGAIARTSPQSVA
ncbi:MAG: hypothetical protein QOF77_1719 [Solirubrobacteraceae bacterium]|jgi:hypothetical protein|nr:hypothetical protein [Solirubrobacteraceae bacterium]